MTALALAEGDGIRGEDGEAALGKLVGVVDAGLLLGDDVERDRLVLAVDDGLVVRDDGGTPGDAVRVFAGAGDVSAVIAALIRSCTSALNVSRLIAQRRTMGK